MLNTPATIHRQRGLSLVELMVALVAGLMVVAIGTQLLVMNLTSGATNLRYMRFNEDLRGAINAISHDVARAGGWAVAADVVQAAANADLQFTGTSGNVTISALRSGTDTAIDVFAAPLSAAILSNRVLLVLQTDSDGVRQLCRFTVTGRPSASTLSATFIDCRSSGTPATALPSSFVLARAWSIVNPFGLVEASSSCIRFSYDIDQDGLLESDDEIFGYRYDAANRSVETRTGDGACAVDGGWNDLFDPRSVEISAFTVTTIPCANTPCGVVNQLNVNLRQYQLQIDGRLKADTAAVRSVQTMVKIRNDSVN